MITRKTKQIYVFGVFRIDVSQRVLFNEKGPVLLTPKAFDTLLVLVENSGQVIDKKDLIEKVWPDSFVEDNNLAQNISTLRKVLDEGETKFIETVPKRGYRFVAAVEELSDPVPDFKVREYTRTRVVMEKETDDDQAERGGVIDVNPAEPRPLSISAPGTFEFPLTNPPQTQYARSGDVNIAYQVIGDAPLDLVFVMGWVSHLEYFWREPRFARFLLRLASFARLIVFDKRGTGLSDRVPINELPTLEQRMDDVRAVMDAAGSERAALCGVSEGGPMCSLFAATYPEKTLALVMIGTYAKRIWDVDYPWAPTTEHRQHFFDEMRQNWGGPVGLEERAPSVAADADFRKWWATYLRMGASPGAALALTQMNAEIDVRQVLPSIRVPTLVIHRTDDVCLRVEEGRYVADRIPGARYLELPGNDHLPFVGDQDAMLDEVEEFLTGVRHTLEPDTVLATVLFTHVVDSKALAERLSEKGWHELRERLRAHVRKEIEWFRGREIDMVGDRPLAIFDGPARAIRCAVAINEYASRLGVQMRSGLHTGECEMVDGTVHGIAPQIGAHVMNEAAPGEVLVTRMVKDLVAGSGIAFREKNIRTLGDLSGEWQLFAVG